MPPAAPLPAGGALAGTAPAPRPAFLPRLLPLGGLALSRQAIGFGGLSALHLEPDGRLTVLNDHGAWFTARLLLDGPRPVGLAELHTGRLHDGAGAPLDQHFVADSESLARLPDGGWLVGFERWHRIRAYRDLDAPGTYVEAPPGLARAPLNGGLESLAVLADGRWLALSESLAAATPGNVAAWIGRPRADGGVDWTRLDYRPAPPDYWPSDVAALPDGGALVLERRFGLGTGLRFRCRLAWIPPAALAAAGPGTVLEAETLLRLEPPLPADNFEGVSVARLGGRTVVALLSDDNESPFQRGVLLLFELVPGR
nr:esterase-like activity of phytase family protein [Roseomonas acroporae]